MVQPAVPEVSEHCTCALPIYELEQYVGFESPFWACCCSVLAPGVFLYSLEVPGAAKAAGLVPAQTRQVCPQTVRRNAS
ncbi:unnamed protein product [Cuscuta campestris]|uniref:Uncharacterized protein n=1 Tax=Cuscuta campestris TaxID=132261 RepID=A0A484M3Q9_9ASTE|nr:unnamed protein product [Cuscuta campestris]